MILDLVSRRRAPVRLCQSLRHGEDEAARTQWQNEARERTPTNKGAKALLTSVAGVGVAGRGPFGAAPREELRKLSRLLHEQPLSHGLPELTSA